MSQYTEKSAKGIKGFLLYSPFHKSHFFRVYDDKDKRQFKDYKITAEDIEIKLLSKFNALIEFDTGENILDYSSEVVKRVNG
jgi:hypothetical protein